jgi:hypothetical protein
MAHLRTFQTGPRASFTQQLLNEVAAARVCLLNSEAKAAYDQMLEGALSATAEPPRSDSATPPEPPPTAPEQEDTRQPPARQSPTMLSWVVAFSVVLLVAVGLGAGIARYAMDYEFGDPGDELTTFELSEERRKEVAAEEHAPVLIYQEADGGIHFTATVAQLHGPTLRRRLMNDVDVITDWESMDDWVSWKFKVVKLPPQGVFQVQVTYAAKPEADGGTFVLAVGDHETECEIRGTGQPVTDEHFLAVPRNGEQTLTLRPKSKPSQRLMTLKSVTFVFP